MRLWGGVFALFAMMTTPALACSCVTPNMELSDQVYQNATMVVEAEVISGGATTWMTGRQLGEQVATVRPVKFYKGAADVDQVMFSYSENTAACGIGTLKEGESRVFILNQDGERLVSAGQCSMILPAYLDKLPEDAPPLVMEGIVVKEESEAPPQNKVEEDKAEEDKADAPPQLLEPATAE